MGPYLQRCYLYVMYIWKWNIYLSIINLFLTILLLKYDQKLSQLF